MIPVAATVGGALVAAIRPPSRRLTAAIQHLAAGIVFAAVALEVIPPVREQGIAVAVAGFASGIVAMYLLQRVSSRLERRDEGEPGIAATAIPIGLLMVTCVDVLIDGVVLGAGFAADSRTGLLLTVALTLELLFLGVSVSSGLLAGGAGGRHSVAITTAAVLLLPVGTAIGVVALSGASANVLAIMLGFGAVALMYLVTEELLTEAHEVAETPLATSLFFVGFLVYLLVAEAIG
jgi:ZIP family zinc transporter